MNNQSQDITTLACAVLLEDSPLGKTRNAIAMADDWFGGNAPISVKQTAKPPRRPGRPAKPRLVAPDQVGRRRLGTVAGRIALLHAIAHIEFNAIDLAADMVARFALSPRIDNDERHDFISDWVQVCADEARHFTMIETRLRSLGSEYGDLLAHDGLWQAAQSTMNDLSARLAIAPMVLEARGLDVTPGMVKKLISVSDPKSAAILQTIYEEEIAHVAAGVRWFSHICQREGLDNKAHFQSLLKIHYKGRLKPPFNQTAREKAGIPSEYYLGNQDN